MGNHCLSLWFILLFWFGITAHSYSQSISFEDGFEDGDFTSDPAWTGDDSLYVITEEDENHLLRLDGNSGDVSAYLSVPSTSVNGSWEFYIRLDFAPSNGNRADVFLMSDIADLNGSVNGYALRAGESGSEDVFRIVRYDGGTEAAIVLSGTTDISSGGGFRVKVIREAGGLWSMEVAEGYDGVLAEEGGAETDNTYSSASYFGVRSTYTSTRSDKFFYDFKIDLPPFTITETTASDNQVEVSFNRPYEQATVQITDFFINNDIGSPASLAYPDSQTIVLHYDNPFPSGQHTLTANDINDLNGEAIETNTTASFLIFDPFESGDMIINEFMYAPPTGQPEYVEVKNGSDKFLNLQNWQIGDDTNIEILSADTLILPPNDFLVISSDTATHSTIFGDQHYVENNLPTLNNGGDAIKLITDAGEMADSLSYTSGWGGNGVALERRSAPTPGIYEENWGDSPAASGGTPGTPNQITADETAPLLTELTILSNEILKLGFDERLDSTMASAAANYDLSNNSISSATITAPDSLQLTLADPLQNAQSYTLTISNVEDIFANAITHADTTFTYYEISEADSGDIFVNEFMYNPPLARSEYIELYNHSNKSLDLRNWTLSDNRGSPAVITNAPFILPPDRFVVLAPDDNLLSEYPDIALIPMNNFPTLNNGSDHILIHDNNSTLLDSLAYISNWGGTDVSLERRTVDFSGTYRSNWGDAPNGFGTPGAPSSIEEDTQPPALTLFSIHASDRLMLQFSEQLDKSAAEEAANFLLANGPAVTHATFAAPDSIFLILNEDLQNATQYTLTIENITDIFGNTISPVDTSFTFYQVSPVDSGDLFINEFMYAPPSGSAEFVELYNPTSRSFDLRGWTINDNTGTPQTITNSSFIVPPDSFVVIAEEYAWTDDPEIAVLSMGSRFPTLNNNEDQIVVRDSSGTLLDSLQYFNMWGGNRTSLERQTTSINTNIKENWGNAPDSLGSPGYRNRRAPDTDPPELEALHIRDSQQLMLYFSERLKTDSATDRANYSLAGGPIISVIDFLAPDRVLISTEETLPNAAQLSLSIQNISDIFGNSITPYDTTFTHYTISEADSGDIFINEFNYHPASGETEYIEIYNTTSQSFDLQNWILNDNRGIPAPITGSRFILPPDSFVVIAPDNTLLTSHPDIALIAMDTFPALNNSGDDIVIHNTDGLRLDSLRYDSNWESHPTLERRTTTIPGFYLENWGASPSPSGTPGSANQIAADERPPILTSLTILSDSHLELGFNERIDSTSVTASNLEITGNVVNSVTTTAADTVELVLDSPLQNARAYKLGLSDLQDIFGNAISQSDTTFTYYEVSSADSGDIFINEFMYVPPSGSAEFVELYNPTSKSFDLRGWTINDNTGTPQTITSASFIVPPDSFIAIAEEYVWTDDPEIAVLSMGSRFPTLNNNGDQIVVRDSSGTLLDSLQYFDTWGGNGTSLERQTTSISGTYEENWGNAPDSLGSAGYANKRKSDTRPPILTLLSIENNRNLLLHFSERLETLSGSNSANYAFVDGPMISEIDFLPPDRVLITVQDSLRNATEYTLTVQNVSDIFGNAASKTDTTFSYFAISLPDSGDVLINEFMVDPREGSSEYIELYNPTGKTLNLEKWTLNDNTGMFRTITDHRYILPPDTFVVIASDQTLLNRSSEIPLITMGNQFPSLNNSGDQIVLRDSSGTRLDSLQYYGVWGASGKALERRSRQLSAVYRANWDHPANGEGSPGSPNTVATDTTAPALSSFTISGPTSLQLIFSERIDDTSLGDNFALSGDPKITEHHFMPPDTVAITLSQPLQNATSYTLQVSDIRDLFGNTMGQMDTLFTYYQTSVADSGQVFINEFNYHPASGETEYIEIYNPTSQSFDLQNWTLNDNRGTEEPISLESSILPPDSYIVLAPDNTLLKTDPAISLIAMGNKFPALNNSGDDIALKNSEGAVLDSLQYTSGWGGNERALERKTITVSAIFKENWDSAPKNSGSPGAENQVPEDEDPPELIELYPIDESKLQLVFSERVAAGSATDLSNYQIAPNRNIQLVSVWADSVTLFLSDPLTSGQSYEVRVSNITDIFGNENVSASQEFEYLRIEGARNGDIVINEIMHIPTNNKPEFVELYNRSDKNIDLTNWSVGDAFGEATISQGIQLRAHSYLILTGSSALAQSKEHAFRLAGFPNLNNTDDILFIVNSAGTAIDSLHYRASWGAGLNGHSLERKDPYAASNDASNWQSNSSDDANSAGIQNASFTEDTSPPKMLFAKIRADERIEVQFDEFIRLTDDLRFTIGGQPLSVSAFDSTNSNSIILQKSTLKAKESGQSVMAENIADIRGNRTQSSEALVAQPLETGDLAINEIMFNPLSDADDNQTDQSEYVELYNTRDYALSLEGLVLHDAPDENGQIRELQPVSTAAKWVLPNETVLIYADQAPKFDESDIANFFDLESAAPQEILQIDRSSLSLASDDDAIYIADSTGVAIDSVHYSETWHNPNLVDTRGIALERITPDGGSNEQANWSSSVHPKGGTPKAQNSIYQEEPQTPQDTGISFTPNPFSPDGDGYEDNLVISYKLDHSDYLLRVNIFDRYGRHIKELADGKPAGFEGSLIWDGRRDDGRRNRIGIYIIVFEAYDSASGSDRAFKKPVVIARKLN